MNNARIVVTGAGGFLGRNLVPELVRAGWDRITAITSQPFGQLLDLSKWEAANQSISFIKRDDIDSTIAEIKRADILVNCAFPRSLDGSNMAAGLRYIDKLFSIAGENASCAIINISSQSVYSQKDPEPATEESALLLESSYAIAKYAAELLMDARCSCNKRTNIRLASLIGPGFDQRVVNKMVIRALGGDDLKAFENGSRFGYLDVRDAVSALVSICGSDHLQSWAPVYNVGGHLSYTLSEIAEVVADVVSGLPDSPKAIGHEVIQTDAPSVYSSIDSTRFKRDFGWVARTPLSETVMSIAREALKD